jgi:hypothetical protein
MRPRELLGDVGQWNLVLVYLKIVLLLVQDRNTVCTERTIGSDWMHPMVVLGDDAQVEGCFGLFGYSANLKQDRCTDCTDNTIDSKSFWTDPMELLGDVGHVESHFAPFGDSISVGAR